MTVILNAKDIPLNQQSGSVPNMMDAMNDYFQSMTFTQIVKQVSGFQNVETPINIDFMGVWQPLQDRKLQMKPEGQRSWKWFLCHSQRQLPLNADDVVLYLGVQYRVESLRDNSLYGFWEYHLVNDYTGAGPNP